MTAYLHVLRGEEITGKGAALDAIAEALAFPAWFGRNLDALHDCLGDLSWLPEGEHVLVWPHREVLAEHDPQASAAIESVLKDAERTLTVLYPV
jgi:RNAse (barnase) inhibitor barstar